jgi:hypothetical protein
MRDSNYRLSSLNSNIKIPNMTLKNLKKNNIVSVNNFEMEKNFKLLMERNENHASKKSI